MNHIKNIFHSVAATVIAVPVISSCTGNFEKYNTEPFSIPKMVPSLLIPSMIDHIMYVNTGNSQMTDQMIGSLGGYLAISNRFGGQNFDTFNASDAWNANAYSLAFTGIYSNYYEIERLTEAQGPYYSMARILKAIVMFRITDLYGPIPYSQIKDGLMYVKYDKAEDVYKNIIADLHKGATELVEFVKEHPDTRPLANTDPIYEGDFLKWARFANTVALRASLRSGDKEAALTCLSHEAGIIEENSQNAIAAVKTLRNPYNYASAGWGDLRTNSSITDYMNGYDDPRMSEYFTPSVFPGFEGKYIGMRAGEADFQKADVAGYSMPNFSETDPVTVMVAAETKFILAEMALKRWIEQDVRKLYEEGITLSMEQYGVSPSKITSYISDKEKVPSSHTGDPRGDKYNYDRKTKVTIAWDESLDNDAKLEKIITQKWIAIWPMGLEAWAEYRRTGYPELAPPIDNLSNGVITDTERGMRRLRYPYTEKDYNLDNYNEAVGMLGGPDNEATDLFWTLRK